MSPPLALPAGTHWRYLHVRFAATAPDGVARTQLFRDDGDGFQESSSVSWQIVADGVERTYVIDLTAHTLPANRVPQRLRLDPLDRPGRLRLARLTLIADLAQVEPGSNLRTIMAERYLRGGGVECGALQNPMTVPATARVIYVDRLTLADARAHYPELDGQTLTPPNLVADLQRLPIGDGRVDFCIGNHLLEHARDPIGGLCQFLRTLRPGGVAFVSVPDVSHPLARGRPVTPFTPRLEDHRPTPDRR
ncbi:MAG: methyltransferase domain-containing protein, partial [Planctomycetes bacterium]|nr:methyltransferase domain-containing protein [Planctomycetota bacterium]